MLQLLGRILLIVFLCGIIIACEKEELSNETPVNDVAMRYEALELEVTNLVNQHRERLGLPTLSVLNLISKEAETHSLYMADQNLLSHDNFDIRHENLVEKTAAISVSENVAFGYKTAEKVLDGWLKSPAHRSNIEAKYFTDFGVSAEMNSLGSYYITQIYIKRD